MRLALPGRWVSTASVATGAVLIAFSLGATPQLDRTLAASASPSSSALQATGHGDHGRDGAGALTVRVLVAEDEPLWRPRSPRG